LIVARKSIFANKRIRKGEKFSEDNLICKRPGNGISPMRWEEVIGKTASRDFEEDEMIEL
jgi:sialic acid synthase SpsE